MIWLVSSYSLSNAASSDMLPSSANWEGFPHGFDLQHPVCCSAPRQCSPHLDLHNFLHGVSVGEAQLHNGGSSPRCKAQASSPCASFSPASLATSSNAGVEICHTGAEQCGGMCALGTADLFSGFHALAGIDPSLKATRGGCGKTSPFKQ